MRVFSEEETCALAVRMADVLVAGDCITLQGDLGAGKTTFARQLITHLCADEVGVISPTFTLLQTYDVVLSGGTPSTIWHYDLYRLYDEEEVRELALEEALDKGVVVIEWPELVLYQLPPEHIRIVIDFSEHPQGRDIRFDSEGAVRQRLEEAGLC